MTEPCQDAECKVVTAGYICNTCSIVLCGYHMLPHLVQEGAARYAMTAEEYIAKGKEAARQRRIKESENEPGEPRRFEPRDHRYRSRRKIE